MGKMPLAAFYRKYLALDCWVPFAPVQEGDIGEISYFVQTSDSANFCQPAPEHNVPQYVIGQWLTTYSPDKCVNGVPVKDVQQCTLAHGIPDMSRFDAMPLLIAAGCVQPYEFTSC